MNDDEFLLLLLQTIRVNGNTIYLLNHGYTLAALNRDIDFLKEKGFVKSSEQDLTLTKKGELFLSNKNRELDRKGLYKYVSRLVSLKQEPMPLNAVYVPLKRRKGMKKQTF